MSMNHSHPQAAKQPQPLTFEQQQFTTKILSQFIPEGDWISKDGASRAILLAFEQGKSAANVAPVAA